MDLYCILITILLLTIFCVFMYVNKQKYKMKMLTRFAINLKDDDQDWQTKITTYAKLLGDKTSDE